MRLSLETADQTGSSLSDSSKTVQVSMQSSLPRAAVLYSVSDSAPAGTQTRLRRTSETAAAVTTDAVAKALTKPNIKPRPGRLVICSHCQHGISVVDRSTQTVSVDKFQPANSAPMNGFASESSSSKLASVQRSSSEQLAVETRI